MANAMRVPERATISPATEPARERLLRRGKFFSSGAEKTYLKGVTYGPFRPDERGCEYHSPAAVREDFTLMANLGFNSVRVYTVPPEWLLDIAGEQGLRVMVGLPWEQHITFLDSRKTRRSIEQRVCAGARRFSGHPALLCYAVGNEIPAPIVRWYGRERVERFLRRLYLGVKAEDPNALVTYVNYPTTEYLQLDYFDFCCFNVYLEQRDRLEAYLGRLQNIAAERPLVMAEIGLDSRRNGLAKQAESLDWQVRTVFEAGCAGAFAFAWTDEWHRGGHDIEDWDFGLTTRGRDPKPALFSVARAFDETPMVPAAGWPKISVIICAYNAAVTLRECLEGVSQLNYPNYEVVVVDDGSTDNTSTIASVFNVRLIRTENGGLSRARNLGLEAASGEIVAYLDSDAYPDPDWLTYIAYRFMHSDFSAVGGPNIHPGTGDRADCVANAPGGPMHVLLSDHEAEHIPGCNMAFRREALKSIGGFDTRFRIAGDDVDVCWRVQQQGWKIGYHAGAMVWHHSRPSIRTFWKQQLNYGRAEAMLEKKWPEKYSRFGHAIWHGRIYGPPLNRHAMFGRWRVYHGTWGSQPFQSIYAPSPGGISSLMLMPEWVLGIGLLALLAILGVSWTPLLLALPLFLAATGAYAINAGINAAQVGYIDYTRSRWSRFSEWCCTSFLHMLQPMARLTGRIEYDLHPWVNRGTLGLSLPTPKSVSYWSETWASTTDWLASIERKLLKSRVVVVRGGTFDRWDLEAWGGFLGATRLLLTVEEHGSGQQLVRLRTWPVFAWKILWVLAVVAIFAILAALDSAWLACGVLSLMSLYLLYRPWRECAASKQAILNVIKDWERQKGSGETEDSNDQRARLVVNTREPEGQTLS